MTGIDVRSLIRKLDGSATSLLEEAIARAVGNTHHTVDIVHFIAAAQGKGYAFGEEIDGAQLRLQLESRLARLPRGHSGAPSFGAELIEVISEGWMAASMRENPSITTGDILRAAIVNPPVRAELVRHVPALSAIDPSGFAAQGDAAPSAAPQSAQQGGGCLAQFTTDLSAAAEEGRLDPVVGRETELAQVIDILLRRRQNNPLLLGEAGVGKTAIAEAFALAVFTKNVPEPLANVRVHVLDIALMQAGAGVKGEFERRLKGLIDEVKNAASPVILFIDEAHSLVGAGNQAGQNDAANLLKPALARGELRTIAATTQREYKKYIEKDPALVRRFTTVTVNEPDIPTAIRMLRAVAPKLEAHHNVTITEEGLEAAVRLSARYIPARQLPDKAVSLLDTAAAAVAVSRGAVPFEMKQLLAEQSLLNAELSALQQDRLSLKSARRRPQIEDALAVITDKIKAIGQKIADEDAHISAINEAGSEDVTLIRDRMQQLKTVQGENPLRHLHVDADVVAELVARSTGIPVGKLLADQIEMARSLEDRLRARVKGQDGATTQIARVLKTARVQLSDGNKPPAIFLFLGMSGVGKTEMAHAIADTLYGGGQSLTVLNMSEYKEPHRVSQLVGSPAGYVGFGEGGILTEAVRRRPYGVLLLDEMEKAHESVQEMFYQVFDKGILRDGEGNDIDFKNTTIIMTANTASAEIQELSADPDTFPDTPDGLLSAIRPALLKDFKPAFLGRLMPVAFNPLNRDSLRLIARMQLNKVRDRIRQVYECDLQIDAAVENLLIQRCVMGDTGARAVKAVIENEILPILADFILTALSGGTVPTFLKMSCGAGGQIAVSSACDETAAQAANF
jgi:type VI secretion system protein VasG